MTTLLEGGDYNPVITGNECLATRKYGRFPISHFPLRSHSKFVACHLERVLHGDLDAAARRDCVGGLAEVRSAQQANGNSEVGAVYEVENVGPQNQPPAAREWEVLT